MHSGVCQLMLQLVKVEITLNTLFYYSLSYPNLLQYVKFYDVLDY